ncbi:MAG: DNA repair protein RadC [Lachnospiraceae bacterium]|nr:DNA repair protein RadC [Lachnospiraceae bacterium]
MNKVTMKELQPDNRPDEKFLRLGPKALTDAELLAIILRTGSADGHSVSLAEQILCRGDTSRQDILNILNLDMDELLAIKGIGTVKSLQIKAIAELSLRIASTSKKKSLSMSDPDSIAQYYMEQLRHNKREVVILLMLNSVCELIKDCVISQGTVNSALLSPREIFLEAIRNEAVNIILLHNHPSGSVRPSKNDINGTERVRMAGELLGIQLLDHIIIGDRKYTSFKETGLINT